MTADRGLKDKPSGSGHTSRQKRLQRGNDSHVANALRSAYEETIRENVPDEFLDLLGKLT